MPHHLAKSSDVRFFREHVLTVRRPKWSVKGKPSGPERARAGCNRGGFAIVSLRVELRLIPFGVTALNEG